MIMMRKAISNEVCSDHDGEKCSSNKSDYDNNNNSKVNVSSDELSLSKWDDYIH